MSDRLKIAYAGTPDFAVPALNALCEHGHDVVVVYTQPDRRSGRGRRLSFSAVKQQALELGIAVQQPQTLRDESAEVQLREYEADVMIVAAYGLILPPSVLGIPTHGCLNIHGSLLPRWRGAAPIQRAIEAGDSTSGVTIMQMAEGLDTGDILLMKECQINTNTTAAALHDSLATLGATALIETLELLQSNALRPVVQNETEALYAQKLDKKEAIINWRDPALVIHRRVCAFNAWPVAQTVLHGETLRIWETRLLEGHHNAAAAGTVVGLDDSLDIATGEGVLRIHRVQAPGKKPLAIKDFLNSREIAIGNQLG